MRLAWLQHLLADRGIDARYLVSMTLTSAMSSDGELYLDLVTERVVDGKLLVAWDNDRRTYGPVTEHVLIPIGGMVFDTVRDIAPRSV